MLYYNIKARRQRPYTRKKKIKQYGMYSKILYLHVNQSYVLKTKTLKSYWRLKKFQLMYDINSTDKKAKVTPSL